MNISDQDIEKLLGVAPQPCVPRALRNQLIAGIRTSPINRSRMTAVSAPGHWLRKWWPALASAAASLVCGVILAVQQIQIEAFKETLSELSATAASEATMVPGPSETAGPPAEALNSEQNEIDRLKEEATALSAKISQLEQTQAENQKLRTQLNARPAISLTAGEQQMMEKARERAMVIQCVNNLKQLGLAARIYENDHKGAFPRDVLSMTNEMASAKILACPADTARQAAAEWATYSAANLSYEYLAADGSPEDPFRILFRCPVHGNIGLSDGSVMSEVGKKHPEAIVQKDGKLYYDPSRRRPEPPPQ